MKKAKLTAELQNTLMPNYSNAFTLSFRREKACFITHFYRLKGLTRYAVLLPIELRPCPTHLVEGYQTCGVSPDVLESLKAFQAVLWSDLFKVSQVQGGESETCNYLVVPAKDGAVDFNLVSSALSKSRSPLIPTPGMFVHTAYSHKILWEVLQVVDCSTSSRDFLVGLIGKDHPDLSYFCKQYANSTVFDILFDDSWSIDALSGFRNLLIKSKLSEVSSRSQVLLVKQVHSVRTNKKSKNKDHYPQGTPVLHVDSVIPSYLDLQIVQEGFQLPQILIDLESFSYVCEFCSQFDFKGDDYQEIYCALRSPSLDAKHNYESLETLGDSVLKFLVSTFLFLDNDRDSEGRLSNKRRRLVSNHYLASVGYEQGIHFYLKAQAIKMNRWKPPYFSSPELVYTEQICHKLSPGMIADTVEAILGAYYVSKGLLHAIELLERLEVIRVGADWSKVRSYCDSQAFDILTAANLKDWTFPPKFRLEDLIPIPTTLMATGSMASKMSLLLKCLNYTPRYHSVFEDAFTHRNIDPSFNYERLEYLGDALLDLVVLSNIYACDHETTPHTMTLIHHALVNNNILAFYSISLGLHSFMAADDATNQWMDCFLTEVNWDDDLLNFGVHSQDPPKPFCDLFESFAAALLIDSGSVSLACRYLQLVMAKPMAYLVVNRSKCQGNIVNRVIEHVQKHGQQIKFTCQQTEDQFTAAAIVEGRELCRHRASSRWLAEKLVAYKAYNILVGSTSPLCSEAPN